MTSDDGLDLVPLRASETELRILDLNRTGMPLLQLLDSERVLCFQTSSRQMGRRCHRNLLALLCLAHNIPGRKSGVWKASGLVFSAAAGFLALFDQSRLLLKTTLFVVAFFGQGGSHLPVRQLHKASPQLLVLCGFKDRGTYFT